MSAYVSAMSSLNNSIERKANNHSRVRYTRLATHLQPAESVMPMQQNLIQPNVHFEYIDDMKQKIFFAKTAKNFYNLAKGYWRP